MKFVTLLAGICGFILISLYSLIGYYSTFGIVSLTPPYNWGTAGMYGTFYHEYRYPELLSQFSRFHPEFTRMSLEYYNTPIKQKKGLIQAYRVRFWDKMRTDWPIFVRNVLRNMVWMWDKDHFSVYMDPFYPRDLLLLRFYNIIIISLCFFGLVRFMIKHTIEKLFHPVPVFTIFLLLYITLLFPLVSNESRHSLPAYPLIFLWAGYGIQQIVYLMKYRNNTNTQRIDRVYTSRI